MTGPSREECFAAAAALEGALHLLDDDESAERLAVLADQWRAQAATTPARAGRCGDVRPHLLAGSPTFCCLPHGHAGWHKGDDGSEWSAP